MKRIATVLMCLVMLCGSAWADVFTVDTETATVEEMEAVITALQKAVKEKKGETEPEMHTFSNGMSVGFSRVNRENDLVTVYFLFSHNINEPMDYGENIRTRVFQNGVEISYEWSTKEFFEQTRQVLKNTTIEVPYSYRVADDSPLTIYIDPWTENEDPYVVTVEIK